jgi:hypothetical protein
MDPISVETIAETDNFIIWSVGTDSETLPSGTEQQPFTFLPENLERISRLVRALQ